MSDQILTPTNKLPPLVPVVAAEKWWVEQSRRNIGRFMTYISDGQRRPAMHHLEWLTAILDPKIKRLLIIAPRESAKANPYSTPILTPSGWIRMGDVKLNDEVFGADGRPHKVIGVYPQGVQDIYRITFTDDSSVECTDDHLWNVRLIGAKDGNRWRTITLNEIRTKRWNNTEKLYTTSDLEKPWLDSRGYSRYHIPITQPIEFPKIQLPIKPYLLGAILGDGGISGGSIRFTSNDKEILQRVSEELPDGVSLKYIDRHDYALTVTIRGQSNSLLASLRSLNLMGTHSDTKFIPEIYLRAALEDRIALLQGLMDTDGSLSKNVSGVRPTFCTTSGKLAKDVIALVNSLGGTSTCIKKSNSYEYKGERRKAKDYYLLHIKLPEGIEPFYLSRKAKDYKPCEIYAPTRGIVDIEYVGKEEAQCIKVDAEDGLYITDHYIVTHNTTIIVNTMAWLIGHFPNATNIITSVSSDQTEERLDALKQIIELPRYNNVFPHIHMDKTRGYNKEEFTVWSEKWPGSPKTIPYNVYRSLVASYGDIKNPTVRAAGITSSKIIGSRFNGIALVDDPHDSDNSATEAQCAKVEKYFAEYVLGGVQHNGKVVVITTRWAELDLAGRLMERKTAEGKPVWHVIDIPCLDGDGKSYWPEYWPVENLQAKREEVGEIMFQTMYMNNPIGASSGMFQPHHLINPLPNPLPEFDRVVIGVDMAESKKAGSDYTVAVAVARDKVKPFGYYVLDMIRGRWDFNEAPVQIMKFADRIMTDYGRLDNIVYEIPASKSHAEYLKEERPDLPVVQVLPKGQKDIRLSYVGVKASSGKLYINQHMYHLFALRSELLGFPKAAHDDCCDALSLPLQLETWSSTGSAGLLTVASPYLL